MPANQDVAISSEIYTAITSASVDFLTFQNKSNATIEITAVADGAPVPAATQAGIEVVRGDGKTNLNVDETFLHIAGAKQLYAKTAAGAGLIYVNHA